jgi:hypothetical protein
MIPLPSVNRTLDAEGHVRASLVQEGGLAVRELVVLLWMTHDRGALELGRLSLDNGTWSHPIAQPDQ